MDDITDHNGGTEATVTRDGITVHQTYQEKRFGVPAVVLKFVSQREDPVEVRVAVELLPDLQIGEVGFHPEYGRENWTVDSNRLEFTDEIGAHAERTTMYAVESLADDQVDSLLDNLSVERVAGSSFESESDTQPGSQFSYSTGTVPAESVIGGVSADEDESDPDVDQRAAAASTVEPDDRTGETAAEATEAERDDQTASDEENPVHGEEDEEEREEREDREDEIEDEHEVRDDANGAGTATEVVAVSGEAPEMTERPTRETANRTTAEDGQTATEPAQPELSDVPTATLLTELRDRTSDLEQSMEMLEQFDTRHDGQPVEAFARIEDELAALDDRLEDVEDDVDSLAEGQDELESLVSTLQEWRDRVESTLSTLGGR